MNKFNLITLVFLFFTSSRIVAMEGPIEEGQVKKRYVTMETIQSMCASIHAKVTANPGSPSFDPDFIIGLSRGGLIPLGFLAGEAMFNNRNVKTISVASYTDEGNQSTLKLLFPISAAELEFLRKFKSILVVDDLVDSGKSLACVTSLLKKNLPESNIKIAALFYKRRSELKPDYYVEETEDWIVFPWEIK